jgi:hypothetical protein
MRNVVKATAAATAVTVAGIALLSPSPSRSATAQKPWRQPLSENGVRFSFEVPSGWERHTIVSGKKPRGPISLNKSVVGPQDAEAIIYWTSFPEGDYAEPCSRLLGRSVGPSAADLAAAVARAPGMKLVSGPSDVRLGGRPAKYVVGTVRKKVGCDPGFFYSWREAPGGAFWVRTDAGSTIRVWIVAVGRTRIFIEAATRAQGNFFAEEIKQIVESIRFE